MALERASCGDWLPIISGAEPRGNTSNVYFLNIYYYGICQQRSAASDFTYARTQSIALSTGC